MSHRFNPVWPKPTSSFLDGTEPSAPAFNEFSPLFLRNRLALQASGVVGSKSTWGDEIVQSGVWNRFSYSLGQFHHETDGFRENNDRNSNLYNAFAQISLNPEASLMAEYRFSDAEKGDLPLRFDPENFEENQTRGHRPAILAHRWPLFAKSKQRYSWNRYLQPVGWQVAEQYSGVLSSAFHSSRKKMESWVKSSIFFDLNSLT